MRARARCIPRDKDHRVAMVNKELYLLLAGLGPIDELSVDVMYVCTNACIHFSSALYIGRAKTAERKPFDCLNP